MASTSSTLEDSLRSMDINTFDSNASNPYSDQVFFRFDPPDSKRSLQPTPIDLSEFDRVQSAKLENSNRQQLLALQEQQLAIRQQADIVNAFGTSRLWSSQIEFF